jgi:hypothetical protein
VEEAWPTPAVVSACSRNSSPIKKRKGKMWSTLLTATGVFAGTHCALLKNTGRRLNRLQPIRAAD